MNLYATVAAGLVSVAKAAATGIPNAYVDSKVQVRNLTTGDGVNGGTFSWYTRTWTVKDNEPNVGEVYYTMKVLTTNNNKWALTSAFNDKTVEVQAGVVSPKSKVEDVSTTGG